MYAYWLRSKFNQGREYLRRIHSKLARERGSMKSLPAIIPALLSGLFLAGCIPSLKADSADLNAVAALSAYH
jgi:hypothetical protein